MSADNWAVCPKCNVAKLAARESVLREVETAYGRVKPAEYLRMLKVSSEPPEANDDLREDYEIGVDKSGVFSVSYRGSCSVCNFTFRYKHSEKVLQEKRPKV